MLQTLRLQTTSVAVIAVAAALTTTPIHAQTTYDIELDGIQFVYDGVSNRNIDLTIQLGDTVRWTWVSGLHNVTSGEEHGTGGSLFSSGMPTDEVGTIFEYTFNDLGMFPYCGPHEVVGMVSAVTVVPEPSTFVGLLALAGMLMASQRRVTR